MNVIIIVKMIVFVFNLDYKYLIKICLLLLIFIVYNNNIKLISN